MIYTPAYLLDIATKAEATYRALKAQFGPGTLHVGRNAARDEMEVALICAAWMDAQGINEAANVGPFMSTLVEKGTKVRIRKGVRIFGTSPQVPREGLVAQRAQVVTAHAVDKGYVDRLDPEEQRVVQGKVTWAGAGGYWRWTDINNIELL